MKKKELVKLLDESIADSPNLELRLETLGKILTNLEDNPNASPRDICCTCGYALFGIVDEMRGNRERVERAVAAAKEAEELKLVASSTRDMRPVRNDEKASRTRFAYPVNF